MGMIAVFAQFERRLIGERTPEVLKAPQQSTLSRGRRRILDETD
jgi:DNA invertase Pin-like site-specific DNA recombinase